MENIKLLIENAVDNLQDSVNFNIKTDRLAEFASWISFINNIFPDYKREAISGITSLFNDCRLIAIGAYGLVVQYVCSL
jgi:hypothetical protein